MLARSYFWLSQETGWSGTNPESADALCEALALCERLVEEFPKNRKYRESWQAALKWMRKNQEHAEMDKLLPLLNKAVELAPEEAKYWRILGKAHHRAQRWREAVAALGKAVELSEGGDGTDVFLLSAACAQLGEQDTARQWRDRALAWLRNRPAEDVQAVVRKKIKGCEVEIAKGTRGLENDLDDYNSWGRRAMYLASRGVLRNSRSDYELALPDLARCAALEPENAYAYMFQQGFLQLALGNIENYRTTCEAMLERFGDTADVSVANCVARTCALGPGPMADPARVMKLAESAREKEGTFHVHFNTYTTLGLALYRAGRFEEARKLLAGPLVEGEHGHFCGWLVMAMVQHKLGDAEEARRWLEEARIWAAPGILDLIWWQRMEFDILRKEAESLIEGEGGESDQ